MMVVQIVSIIVLGVVITTLVVFAYLMCKEPGDCEKVKQLESVVRALIDENQRIRFRLRRIEDKLGIKEGDN